MKNDETMITCEMLTLAEATALGLLKALEAHTSLPTDLLTINVDDFLIRMYVHQEC